MWRLGSFSFFYFTIKFMNFIFFLRELSINLIFIRSKLWSNNRRSSFSLGWFLNTLVTITDLHSQLACILELRCCRWSWTFDLRAESLLFLKILRWFPHVLAIYTSVGNQLFNLNFLDVYIGDWDMLVLAIIKRCARNLFALIFIEFLRRFHFIWNW